MIEQVIGLWEPARLVVADVVGIRSEPDCLQRLQRVDVEESYYAVASVCDDERVRL
jgi:hypothetical protein